MAGPPVVVQVGSQSLQAVVCRCRPRADRKGPSTSEALGRFFEQQASKLFGERVGQDATVFSDYLVELTESCRMIG